MRGIFSSTAEVSGFLEYQLHVKGIVLYCWCILRCIKSWIAICYRGLKFPHRAVVLLVLESDAACTSLSGHCARTGAVLVLVWCYNATGDREQNLWRYRPSEAALCSGMTSLQVMVASAINVGWGRNEGVTLLCIVPWPSTLTCRVKSQDLKLHDYHHWPDSPFTQLITLCLFTVS